METPQEIIATVARSGEKLALEFDAKRMMHILRLLRNGPGSLEMEFCSPVQLNALLRLPQGASTQLDIVTVTVVSSGLEMKILGEPSTFIVLPEVLRSASAKTLASWSAAA